ncbi:MAG: hypothetical protein IT203_03855 [Fimbriimonadaceae bacterium]|nr:hypothetical protein [Fimbriimonadaceae bacterium]
MKDFREDDALIRMALEELPMSNEMPQNLKSKLTDRALNEKRKARTVRRPWLVGIMTAGLATLALGAFFILPRPALGKTWTMIRDAVDQVRTFQMEVKENRDGKSELVHIAVADGRMKIDSGEQGIVYIDRNSIQIYDKDQNTVMQMVLPLTEITDAMPDVMGEISKNFDLKKELAEYEKKYGKDHIRIMPIRDRDGRSVYDVVMTDPNGLGTVNMTVDADTNLPTDIMVRENHEGKTSDTVVTMRYNDAVVIQPNFPSNAKIQKVDLGGLSKLVGDSKKLGEDMKKMGEEMKKSFEGKVENQGGVR